MYTKSEMAKKIDVKDVLKRNRSIDPGKLAEVLKIIEELNVMGVKGESDYNLLSPFTTHKPWHTVGGEEKGMQTATGHRCK